MTPPPRWCDAAVAALLEHVPVSDREVLRLALIHELDGESLARALGVRPGAARVRLHRALGRLREAVIRDGSAL
jgi:RNA polymerase sigma-70 factor (ECF subfamily)